MNIQRKNSALHFRMQSEREQTEEGEWKTRIARIQISRIQISHDLSHDFDGHCIRTTGTHLRVVAGVVQRDRGYSTSLEKKVS